MGDTTTASATEPLRGRFKESVTPARVAISDIFVPEDEEVRGDEVALRTLADSIVQLGQLMPVIISTDGSIVAGRRRLAAHKLLGKKKILAIVRDCTPDEAELIEIDENFARQELTVLERAVQMARRRELYEARSKGSGKRVAGFAEDAAAASGASTRTIQRLARIGKDLTPEAAVLLHGTRLADSTQTLLKVSRLPGEEQVGEVRRLLGLDAPLVEEGPGTPVEQVTVAEPEDVPTPSVEFIEEEPAVETECLPADGADGPEPSDQSAGEWVYEPVEDDLEPPVDEYDDAWDEPEPDVTEWDSPEADDDVVMAFGEATVVVANPFWPAIGSSILERSRPELARDAVLYATIPAAEVGAVSRLLEEIDFVLDGVVGAWTAGGDVDSGFLSPSGVLVRFTRGAGVEATGPLEMGLQAGFGRPLSPPLVINALRKYLRDIHPGHEIVDLLEIGEEAE